MLLKCVMKGTNNVIINATTQCSHSYKDYKALYNKIQIDSVSGWAILSYKRCFFMFTSDVSFRSKNS